MRKSQSLAAVLIPCLALMVIACRAPAVRGQDAISQRAVDRAHAFLKSAQRGRDILSYVHFGARYDGHSYKDTRFVLKDRKRVPGHFALVYSFDWQGDGTSDVALFCDSKGNVYDVSVLRTNAVLNQPFLTANATIQVLGNLLVEAFKDNLNDNERRDIQRLVDNADARGMLRWSLRFQQALSR